MRIWFFIALLMATSAFANVQVRDGRITANINSEPLTTVLDTLKSQTGMSVSIEPGVGDQPVSANFEDLPIAAGIKKILEGTGINYVVVGDAEGEPSSLFIGSSERLGAGGPAANNPSMPPRGVVAPVAPLAPVQPVPQSQPLSVPAGKGLNPKNTSPAVTVPTGGGFVPNSDKNNNPNQQQVAPNKPQIPPEEQQSDEEDDSQQ